MIPQDYKRHVERQHAPEELIQKTLLRIQELPEEKEIQEKQSKVRVFSVKQLAIAASLVFVIGGTIFLGRMGNQVSFYQMEARGEEQLNFGLIQMNKQVWSMEEFAAKMEWNTTSLIASTDIQVTDEINGTQSIRGEFTYHKEDIQSDLELMQDEKIDGVRYTGAEAVSISGIKVYFAEDEEKFYAFYEQDNKIVISAKKQIKQGDFVLIIKDILK